MANNNVMGPGQAAGSPPRRRSELRQSLTSALKTLRSSQPFNWLATGIIRSLLRATGAKSEAVIKHLHRVGNVQCPLPNGRRLRLWSRGDDWISNQVYWRGWNGYEPETVPLFFALASRAKVTIDVGAHVGLYTLLAAHASREGKVYAFEPMPAVHERLRHNVALNGVTNVECMASAAGAADSCAEFFHTPGKMPSSSSLSLEFMRTGFANLLSTTVPVITLDRFVRERGLDHVDLFKIDTETTEPQVLRGAAGVLARDKPTIICEVLRGRGTEAQLAEILRPFGYRFYLLTPDGPVLRESIEGHPVWLNYLFSVGEAMALPDSPRRNHSNAG